jgi:prepilin-type N-terminal cleavage/methylation domain-containing protein
MNRGFTLLEVLVAAALLSVVTGAAMAAYIAQTRIINTQQQTSSANDHVREAIRILSNDARAAGAGLNLATSGFVGCAPGTIPYDYGAGAASVACLPPMFRSTSPLYFDGAVPGSLWPAGNYAACVGGGLGPYSPGYQLNLGSGAFVPSAANLFCPDDLVVLAVDDTEPLFMVQSTPTVSSVGNVTSVLFAGSNTATGFGFDDAYPALPPPPATATSPMMLFGGATSAVLMNVAAGVAAANYLGGPCLEANCGLSAVGLIPRTSSVNFFASNLNFGTVALPARLMQYHIQPVNALGQNVPPFVSANLVRSTVVPAAVGLGGGYPFTVVDSHVLIEGVVDMQVEFGFDPTGTGLLRYVSSGGTQSITAVGPPPYGPDALQQVNNCAAGAAGAGVYSGLCFPNNGINGLNVIQLLRTVRITLTVRSATIANSTSFNGATSSAGRAGTYFLRPGVMDICPPAANVEAANWGFTCPANVVPLPTTDGANYRQVSTEIYVRNLGLGT